ncbi:hypothetical protein EV360DRAFT_73520, partial [Lentinula raphanica]
YQSNVGNQVQTIAEGDEKLYTCTTCLNLMFQPYSLVCGHSFCRECLHTLGAIFANGRQNFTCPECRHVQGHFTPIPNFRLQDQVEALVISRGLAYPTREELDWPLDLQAKTATFPFTKTRGSYPIDPQLPTADAPVASTSATPPAVPNRSILHSFLVSLYMYDDD